MLSWAKCGQRRLDHFIEQNLARGGPGTFRKMSQVRQLHVRSTDSSLHPLMLQKFASK